MAPLLALWPVQNGPELGGGIAEAFSHPLQTIREDFGTTRLDQNFSDKDSLAAVYTIDDSARQYAHSQSAESRRSSNCASRWRACRRRTSFRPLLLNTATRRIFARRLSTSPARPRGSAGLGAAGEPIGAVVIGGGTALNGASQITGAGTNAGSNLTAARNLFTYDDHVA